MTVRQPHQQKMTRVGPRKPLHGLLRSGLLALIILASLSFFYLSTTTVSNQPLASPTHVALWDNQKDSNVSSTVGTTTHISSPLSVPGSSHDNKDQDDDAIVPTSQLVTVKEVEEDLLPSSSPPRLRQNPDPTIKYMLLRTIGNALPPRHDPTRTLRNLRFILENEQLGDLELRKHWVLNRIIDTKLLQQIKELLEEFQAEYTVIPFKLDEYARIPFQVVLEDESIDRVHFPQLESDDDEWTRVQQFNGFYNDKNRYALGINVARNVMLDIGKDAGARWILPWDQNCFLTKTAWKQIRADLVHQEHVTEKNNAEQAAWEEIKAYMRAHGTLTDEKDQKFMPVGRKQPKYFVTWMDRLTQENDVVLSSTYTPNPWEEPQLIFRNDAVERFDEQLRYGNRDKAALLVRLKVPGVWNQWGWSPWEERRTFQNISRDIQGVYVPATGYVVRLYSGMGDLEQNEYNAAYWRELKRGEAVVSALNKLEARVMNEIVQFHPDQLLTYNETMLRAFKTKYENSGEESDPDLQTLLDDAEKALQVTTPWTITSNDPLDAFRHTHFFSNFYDKRDEKQLDDGQLMKQMVYNTTALVLAWEISGEKRFAAKALEFLDAWCVNKTTIMQPNLNFADMSYRLMQKDDLGYSTGSESGIRHTFILSYLLDAMRLLFKNEGLVSEETKTNLKSWVEKLYDMLRTDQHILQRFRSSTVLFGLQYDLQVAAMAAFLNKPVTVRYTLGTMHGRLVSMVDSEGKLIIPLAVLEKPYILLSLATWSLAIEYAQRFNLVSHLFRFDLPSDRRGETTSEEGLLCRLVAAHVPCCRSSGSGACVTMLQESNDMELFIYARIARQAMTECPSLQAEWSCQSLAEVSLLQRLSAEEMSHYQLPPYLFLRGE